MPAVTTAPAPARAAEHAGVVALRATAFVRSAAFAGKGASTASTSTVHTNNHPSNRQHDLFDFDVKMDLFLVSAGRH